MKYKIGDKFRRQAKYQTSAFETGEIIATIEGDYILSVQGHVNDNLNSIEDGFLVRRGELELGRIYELAPDFFKQGKTYRYSPPQVSADKGVTYEIANAYLKNDDPSQSFVARQALAIRTKPDRTTSWALLSLDDLEYMEEVS